MQTFYAKDHGVIPGCRAARPLSELLQQMRGVEGEKTLVFERGDYLIDSRDCDTELLYITNTVGDKEFTANETPHENKVALNLKGLRQLKIVGNGARFIIDGKATNIALQQCEEIEISDIELRAVRPDMHELKVMRKTPFSVDFQIDCESGYEFKSGKLWFLGSDYRVAADAHALNAHWIGCIHANTPERVKRVSHPLFGAIRMRELAPRLFRVQFPNTLRFHCGDRFYLFDVRRQFAGIFVNGCREIKLHEIRQRFNYSLALVAQDSENITVDSVEFAPEEGAARMLASVADFIQVCMCKGEVNIVNSRFEGAGDDCLNVHGIHFKITRISGNTMVVRFMHPQSHGFNPLHAGDEIALIDPATMLEKARARAVSSRLLDEYEIELTLDSAQGFCENGVIEDVTMCPHVRFANNTLSRIITRGLLLTTRGRVVVENNRFVSTSMSGILLSDDARNWYESGMCCDVTIQNNVFSYCGQTPVLIKPENSHHAGAVHRNIRILGNVFEQYKGPCIRAKSSDEIAIKGNRFHEHKKLKAVNCQNVQTDF